MAKIKGVVYLLIGMLVLAVSIYVDGSSATKDLQFFFYVGLVFLVWGIIKTIFDFLRSQSQRKVINKTRKQNQQANMAKPQNVVSSQKNTTRLDNTKQSYQRKFCHNCGKHVGPIDNFCYYCGTRLR